MNALERSISPAQARVPATRTRRWAILAMVASVVLLGLEPRAAQFEDISNRSGIGQSSGACYGAAWGDYNNDGFRDLFLLNGYGFNPRRNDLFWNRGNGTFSRG